MEIKLVPGDKVRLVSGGPEMTVRGNHYDVNANVYSTNMVDCIWFAKNKDGKEEVQYCPFQEEELIKTRSA
ncbi:MAG: DUF2158 domain-containing protein [Taibaiella sp.]|jgi:uncharacterized protein YodC (DUF2158 family)|nr:DUF2158 domain-containing protein [Taibaiella sp.]